MKDIGKISTSLLLEHCGNAMICLSTDNIHKVLEFNFEAEKLLNISNHDILDKNIFSFCSDQKIELPFTENDLKIKENKETFSESSITLPNQIKKFIQQKFIFSEPNTNPNFVMILIRDVTNIINDSSSIYLRNVVENLPQYIYWKDINSIYRGCNKHVAEYLRLKNPEEIIGKTDGDFHWTEERINFLQEGDYKVMKEGKTISVEDEIPNPDGTSRIMLTSKSPLFCKLGKVVGVLGVSTDITEQKQIQAQLKEAKEEAEESNLVKSVFIENMSHDFKTPLNGISGALQVLDLTPDLPEDVKKMIIVQKKSVDRLEKMIGSILNFNRIYAGKVEIQHEELNLLETIENIVENLSYIVKDKNVNIIIHYPPNIPRHLLSDSSSVTSILLNLMSNAVKFTDEGVVSISVQLEANEDEKAFFKIIVEDTGMGIPKDKLQQIFERFHRLELSNKGQKAGHGIGLALVKELVERLNGQINVQSQLGKGSVFTVNLPFEIADATFFVPEWKKHHSDIRILLVSDKETSSDIILDQFGETVVKKIESNLFMDELLSQAKTKTHYQILIVDDQIEFEEPIELLKKINNFKNIPKMMPMLSIRPQNKKWFDQARASGYFDFIVKPILPTEFDKKIIDAWKNWQSKLSA